MAGYRYVGGAPAKIYHHDKVVDLTSYGQLIDLPAEAAPVVLTRLHLLPAEEFNAIHPLEDVRKYARFESHTHADAGFLERRGKARAAVKKNLATG